MLSKNIWILLPLSLYLAGCASITPGNRASTGADSSTPPYHGGRYYKDDGPERDIPANLDQIPDAVPKPEILRVPANKPYSVFGQTYTPIAPDEAYREDGYASWYGRRFAGKTMSSGEPYDMYAMTAAHPTLPIPSYARVTNVTTGKHIVVRVTDRGPFLHGRIIDLSYTAAYKLDVLHGVTLVRVEKVTDSDSAQGAPSVKPEDTGIYLQIGAFASLDAAKMLLDASSKKLDKLAEVTLRILDTGSLHKVQIGPFRSVALARQAVDTIEQELSIRPYLQKQASVSAQLPEVLESLKNSGNATVSVTQTPPITVTSLKEN